MLPFNPFLGREHNDFLLEGSGPAVLLVHGFPGTPAEMWPLARALNERGWTARGLLLPGFGSDLDSLPVRRAEDWARAVSGALQDLRREHAPVMVIGNSMGAALSLRAAEQDCIDGLVVLSPFWKFASAVWPLLPLLKRMVPFLRPFRWVKINYNDGRVRGMLAKFFPRNIQDDPRSKRDLRAFKLHLGIFDEIRRAGEAAYRAASQVHIPLLAIQGTSDKVARRSMTRLLLNRYAGRVDYAEVAGDHDLLDSTLPVSQQVRSLVLSFAGKLLEARPGPC